MKSAVAAARLKGRLRGSAKLVTPAATT